MAAIYRLEPIVFDDLTNACFSAMTGIDPLRLLYSSNRVAANRMACKSVQLVGLVR
jgi:hypothetical protein